MALDGILASKAPSHSYDRVAGRRGFAPRSLALVSVRLVLVRCGRCSRDLQLKVNRRRPSPSLV